MLTLQGKSALVTGGSRGIGRAICLLFGRLGARVVVNYVRDEGAAQKTVGDIVEMGGEAFAVQADVSLHDEAGRLVTTALERLGSLDIVVVNQGIWKRASIENMTPEEWDETMSVNLRGAYSLCHHTARVMIPRRSGSLILIASTSGQRGEAHYSHYSSTKGALLALTWSLAAELAPHGIRVNGVAPGWVVTDMTRDALSGAEGDDALRAIPLGRPGTPEEIAGPVAFLASDLASFVYGEVLAVNGGAVMVD
ncbi:MAG TPA: 3-oxoacyl-ACP reductase family protein [Vicinamibacteria bacterium]|jgi:3-oxoacyl-[acyl-carrier protein] reductase|nr:3-oxoacyl-ACP reductase family protein [Vicinamibacteria bacterium]